MELTGGWEIPRVKHHRSLPPSGSWSCWHGLFCSVLESIVCRTVCWDLPATSQEVFLLQCHFILDSLLQAPWLALPTTGPPLSQPANIPRTKLSHQTLLPQLKDLVREWSKRGGTFLFPSAPWQDSKCPPASSLARALLALDASKGWLSGLSLAREGPPCLSNKCFSCSREPEPVSAACKQRAWWMLLFKGCAEGNLLKTSDKRPIIHLTVFGTVTTHTGLWEAPAPAVSCVPDEIPPEGPSLHLSPSHKRGSGFYPFHLENHLGWESQ